MGVYHFLLRCRIVQRDASERGQKQYVLVKVDGRRFKCNFNFLKELTSPKLLQSEMSFSCMSDVTSIVVSLAAVLLRAVI